ncbi:hypothetical protein KFE25_000147 [Diacronema lutheri]|uniref:SF3 helicase domain-containing protein n=1 Tax=Diacronema lutheri TaxID=2081491 RepID=A0A8J5XG87_DIALT|nr:hypothetical protein KFE25_000147 [Diacronema lutheri]
MDQPAVARLTEIVRRDRLEYLAARESGQCYSKDGAHQVRNYASRALERGRRVGDYVHYDVGCKHGRNTPGYGMLFPTAGTPGLQSIMGETKRFQLEGAPVYDIDQVNAIPTLMIQDARRFGKPLPQLESYVADRGSWLVQIAHDASCSQKQAKQLVLSILFGGSHASWLKANNRALPEESDAFGLVDGLEREMRRYVPWWDATHGTAVRCHDLCTDGELRAQGTSPAFRRISLFYQDLETKMTLSVKQVLESAEGMTVRVLCHDGLIASLDDGLDNGCSEAVAALDDDSSHVESSSGVGSERGTRGEAYVRSLLPLCVDAVKSELGYHIVLELKSLAPKSGMPFEQYVQQQWPAETLYDAPGYDPKLKGVQDRLFAEHLIKVKAGRFFKQRTGDDKFTFWSHNGCCWEPGWALIGGWCEELLADSPYGASAPGIKRLRDYLTLACPGLIKEPIFDQVLDGVLPCLGGLYYEAVTRATRPIPLEHFVTRLWDLPPPFIETVAEDDLEWVRARVAEVVPHEGLLRSIVPRLAHDLLTVGNPHKSICFFIGDGDNDKTTLMKVIKGAAPPGWVISTRANTFTGRADGSQQTDWLSKLDGARIVYTEEPRRGEAGSLDCEWLKEVRGDSDVSTRKIYGSEREMRVSFSLYFMANHMPQTAHADEALLKSFIICDLPGKFVDDPATFKNNLSAPWKEYVRPIDRELKAKFGTPQMRSALMLYLCEEYRAHVLSDRATFEPVPAEFAKWKDEVVVEKDLICEAFYSAYEPDEHATEPVRTRDLMMHVRGANPELKLNEQALGGFLKREFTDAKHPYVTKKKAHGVMVWVGLKLKSVAW